MSTALPATVAVRPRLRQPHRGFRRIAVATTAVVAVLVGLVATPSSAEAIAPASAISGEFTVTHGVSEYSQTWTGGGPKQQVSVLDVNLADPNVRVDVVESHNKIQDPVNETVTSMGNRTGAVAGINGDYFDINASGEPRGAVISGGQVLKSTVSSFDAQLGVRPDGSMVIGRETYTGQLTDGANTHKINAVNVLSSAATGGIVRISSALGAAKIPAATLVLGQTTATGLLVDSVTPNVTTVPALSGSQSGYLASGAGASWLTASIHVGDTISATESMAPDAHLSALLSGVSVLVKNGAPYHDLHGTNLPKGTNRETAVGLSADGKHAIFIALGGLASGSHVGGATVKQVTAFLVKQGVADAVLLDGGGSTTLAARKPGATSLTLMTATTDASGQRKVANGIFLYTRESSPGPATSIVLNGGRTVTTLAGAKIPLGSYARDAKQNPAAGSIGVTVSPASLGSYAKGVLTARRGGTGTLTARSAGAVTHIPLRVVSSLSTLRLSPTKPNLLNAATRQFTVSGTATVGGKSGVAVTLPSAAAKWSVSSKKLGTISTGGLFRAAATGTGLVTVVATAGGKRVSTSVAVGARATTINPMTTASKWTLRNTTGRPATLRTAAGVAPPGSGRHSALQVTYSLPGNSGVRQLVLFPKSKTSAARTHSKHPLVGVGWWVYGDGSGIDLAIALRGANGATATVYPGPVTWKGWRLVSIPIPSRLTGAVSVSWVDLLGIDPPKDEAGTIYLGGLAALYSPR